MSGTLTLRLKDVPWDQALQIIMEAKGLGMRKTGSVLWIAPKDEIDARTKRDLEAALAIESWSRFALRYQLTMRQSRCHGDPAKWEQWRGHC